MQPGELGACHQLICCSRLTDIRYLLSRVLHIVLQRDFREGACVPKPHRFFTESYANQLRRFNLFACDVVF